MNRLQAELQRLYALEGRAAGNAAIGAAGAATPARMVVLELARPPGWEALSAAWQGVQADLALPAPAIAVSGVDSYQLWFSVDERLPRTEALAFLQGLCRRYLAEVPSERIRMFAGAAPLAAHAPQGAPPPTERSPGRWSAFVAPDLAALFADEPWLDMPPSADAQADVLARLQPTPVEDLRRAVVRLAPAGSAPAGATQPLALEGGRFPGAGAASDGFTPHPRRFLLAVMDDPAVDLSLRIEAAKALLPYCGEAPHDL